MITRNFSHGLIFLTLSLALRFVPAAIASSEAALTGAAAATSEAAAGQKCYEIAMHGTTGNGDDFFVLTTNAATIQTATSELKLAAKDRHKIIDGSIDTGNGGFNGKWHWHIITDQWDFTDMATEVCDGTPSYVEDHRVDWVAHVKYYCPWASYVLSECASTTIGAQSREASGDGILSDEILESAGKAVSTHSTRQVTYRIGSEGRIDLEILSADGKFMAGLFTGYRSRGSYVVSWDPRLLGPKMGRGIYHLVLKKNGRPVAARTVLLTD